MNQTDLLPVNSPGDLFGVPKALAGRHIAVTWPAELGAILTSFLIVEGARVTPLFAGDLVPAESTTALDTTLSRLDHYDRVMVTSLAGVDAFVTRLVALGIRSDACPHIDISLLFPVMARTSEHALLLRQQMLTGGLTSNKELKLRDLSGKRILLLCAAGLHNSVAASLRRCGAEVDEVSTYRIVTYPVDAQSLRLVLETRRADDGICTSAIMADGLLAGLAKLGQHPVEALRSIPLITLDAAAAAILRQAGLESIVSELVTGLGLEAHFSFQDICWRSG